MPSHGLARWVGALSILAGLACSDSAPGGVSVQVDGAWARTSAGEGGNSAVYMTVRNPGRVSAGLVGGRCDGAGRTELHRTTIDPSGLAQMAGVDRAEIPAGGALALEPGGYHLMLLGVGELVEGDTLTCTLRLASADSVVVRVPVRSF